MLRRRKNIPKHSIWKFCFLIYQRKIAGNPRRDTVSRTYLTNHLFPHCLMGRKIKRNFLNIKFVSNNPFRYPRGFISATCLIFISQRMFLNKNVVDISLSDVQFCEDLSMSSTLNSCICIQSDNKVEKIHALKIIWEKVLVGFFILIWWIGDRKNVCSKIDLIQYFLLCPLNQF
jgi:hypothetical protein